MNICGKTFIRKAIGRGKQLNRVITHEAKGNIIIPYVRGVSEKLEDCCEVWIDNWL